MTRNTATRTRIVSRDVFAPRDREIEALLLIAIPASTIAAVLLFLVLR